MEIIQNKIKNSIITFGILFISLIIGLQLSNLIFNKQNPDGNNSNYLSVYADEPIPTEGLAFTAIYDTDGVIVIAYSVAYGTATDKNVVIPATYNGEPVTTIGEGAFQSKGLTSVVIPDSVIHIGNHAFQANQLTSIAIPDSVITIGNYAFSGNSIENFIVDAENQYFTSDSYLNELRDETKRGILYDYSKTTILAYGGGLVRNVTADMFPDTITIIGTAAFQGNQLTSIAIPNSVTTISSEAFANNLLASVVIPNAVNTIGDFAFAWNQLENLIIGDDVITIGMAAFIGNDLMNIIIPDSVTTISSEAFALNQLTDIVIGKGLQNLGYRIFYGNPIENFTVDAENQYFTSDSYLNELRDETKRGILYDYSKTTIIYYGGGLVRGVTSDMFPDTITIIGDGAFSASGMYAFTENLLTSVEIPNSVTTIGNLAFYGNLLTSVEIPNSVTTIGNWAFYGNLLTSIEIPNSVTEIGGYAFSENPDLQTVFVKRWVGENITSLSDLGVFDNTDESLIIYVPSGSVTTYKAANYWSEYASRIVSYDTYSDEYTEGIQFEEFYNSTTAQLEVRVIGYTGLVTDVIIPAVYNGKPVTEIGNSAFDYYRSSNIAGVKLTGVIIPNSVMTVGNSALAYNQLTSVTIPNSVTTIGSDAFKGNPIINFIVSSSNLYFASDSYANEPTNPNKGILYNKDKTTLIYYGGGLRKDIVQGVIPNSVTTIGNYAFASNQFTSVVIPNSVTTIGDNAFRNNQLTSIVIPNSVITIQGSAFVYNQLTNITIGSGVKTIGETAFVYNQLTSVTIPNSVTTIGSYAFSSNQLTRVVIPSSVTTIGNGVFRENPDLQTVFVKRWVGENITSLSDLGVFDNTDESLIIYVPSGSVTAYQTAEYWSAYADRIVSYDTYSDEYTAGIQFEEFYNSTTAQLEVRVIDYTGVDTDVIIPAVYNGKPVTEIGENAFYYNQLTSVVIPNSVITIQGGAFAYNQFTSVVIPNSVTTIGNSAFYYNQLTNITIGSGVTAIEDWAFGGNPIINFTIDGGNQYFTSDSYANEPTNPNKGILYNKDKTTLIYYGGGLRKDIVQGVISNSVTAIGDYAFATNQLTSVVIGNSVTTIGNWAFYNNQLTSVVIPNSITTIGNNAFAYGKLTSLVIPNSVTTIDSSAFAYNQLTSVVIGAGLTVINNSVFTGNKLTSIEIPDNITTIGCDAFGGNNLLQVTIGKNVNYISYGAFGGNPIVNFIIHEENEYYSSDTYANDPSNLNKGILYNIDKTILYYYGGGLNKDITAGMLPDSIIKFDFLAFANIGLNSIIIPKSVQVIEWAAFSNNNLVSVILPKSVTFLGLVSFQSNPNLIEIYVYRGISDIGGIIYFDLQIPEIMFSGTHEDLIIYVLNDSVDAYNAADGWSCYANRIQGFSLNVSVEISDLEKVYGSADPEFSYVVKDSDGNVLENITIEGFVREAGENVGSYTISLDLDNVVIKRNGVVTNDYSIDELDVIVGSLVINPKPITVALMGTANKIYDASDEAILTTNNYAFTGVISGDDVVLTYVAVYSSKNAGTGRTITVTSLGLAGDDFENYVLTTEGSFELSGNISKRQIGARLSDDIEAEFTGETVFNVKHGDIVFYDMDGVLGIPINDDEIHYTGLFESQTTDQGQTVFSLTELVIDNDNYELVDISEDEEKIGYIIKRKVYVVAELVTKQYDGTDSATGLLDYEFIRYGTVDEAGLVEGDTTTTLIYLATYGNKEVGTGKVVTLTNYSISNPNYELIVVGEFLQFEGEITPKEIEVVWGTLTSVYDGDVKVVNASVNTGVIGESLTLEVVNLGVGQIRNAGEYDVMAQVVLPNEFAGNYILTNDEEVYEITKKDLAVYGKGKITKTYDSNDLATVGTVEGVVSADYYSLVGLVEGDEITLLYETAKYNNKNAGNNKVITVTGLSIDNDNYSLVTEEVEITGEILTLQITLQATAVVVTKSYDGTTVATDQVATVVGGNVLKPTLYTLTGVIDGDVVDVSFTGAGYLNKNVEYLNNKVNVTGITSGNNNYTFNVSSLQFDGEIVEGELELDWGSLEFTYNAGSQKPVPVIVSGGHGAIEILVEIAEGKDGVNAGTYTAIASASDSNYIIINDSVEYEIIAKEIVIDWFSTDLMYNGQEQAPEVYYDIEDVFLSDRDSFEITVTKAINAGNHTSTASTNNSNYVITNPTFNYTINKRDIYLNWSNLSFTYDGNPHKPTATINASDIVAGDVVNVTISDVYAKTNAGESYEAIAAVDNNNYTIGNDWEMFEIRPITLTITPNSEIIFTKVYDYEPHYSSMDLYTIKDGNYYLNENYYSVSGLLEGDVVNLYVIEAYFNSPNVAEANILYVEVSFDNVNYTFAGDGGQATDMIIQFEGHITPASITLSAEWSLIEKEYDNSVDAVNQVATTTGGNVLKEYLYNASTYFNGPVTFTSAEFNSKNVSEASYITVFGLAIDDSNYELSSNTLILNYASIYAKEVEVEWSDLTLAYNGAVQYPNMGLDVPGEVLLQLSFTIISGDGRTIGTHRVRVTLDNANYSLINNETNYTITGAAFEVIWENTDLTYNGEVQKPTAKIIMGESQVYLEVEVNLTPISAGNYSATAIKDVTDENYTITNNTLNFTIKKKELTLTANSSFVVEKEYDGDANAETILRKSLTGLILITNAYNLAGVVDGETVSLKFTSASFDSANAGDRMVTVNGISIEDDDNYSLNVNNLELTGLINKRMLYLVDYATPDYWPYKEYDGTNDAKIVLLKSGTENVLDTSLMSINYEGGGGGWLAAVDIIFESATFNIVNAGYGIITITGLAVNDPNRDIAGTAQLYGLIIEREINVTWSNTTFTYDGNSHKPTANYNPEDIIGDDVVVVTVNGEQVNANYPVGSTYTATAVLSGNTNYKISEATETQTFTINRATATITVNLSAFISKVYDQNNLAESLVRVGSTSELKAELYEISGLILGDSVTVEFTSAKFNSWSPALANVVNITGLKSLNSNYVLDKTSLAVAGQINVRIVTINWQGYEVVYNGSNIVPGYSISNAIIGDDLLLVFNGWGKDVGEYTVTVETNNENYGINPASQTITYNITPKLLTVVWGGTALSYTGEVVHPLATINTGVTGETVTPSYEIISGDGINVGTHRVKVSITDDNYSLSNDETDYEIDKLGLEVVWSNTTATFNNSPQKPIAKVFVDDQEVTLTVVLNGDGINVGAYTATASYENELYRLTNHTRTFTINPKEVIIEYTLSQGGSINKVYDGTTGTTVTVTDYVVVDSTTFEIISDSNMNVLSTLSYESKNVGSNHINLTFDINSNYVLVEDEFMIGGQITPKAININQVSIVSKEYDGNADAVILKTTHYTLSGVLTEDLSGLNISYYIAEFNSANVGDNLTVTVSNLELNSDNYEFANETYLLNGRITKRTLQVTSATYISKVYDGNVSINGATPEIVLNVSGIVDLDEVNVSYTAGSFDNKNAGTNKDVTLTLQITDGNYILESSTLVIKGEITQKALTVVINYETLTGLAKEYDGTTSSNLTINHYELVGLINDDEAGWSYHAEYESAEVGERTIIITYSITNTNYYLTNPTDSVEGKSYISIVLDWDNLIFTYDKNPHKPTVTVLTEIGEELTIRVDGGGINEEGEINAGTYTAIAYIVGSSIYVISNPTYEYTIFPRQLTIEGSLNTSFSKVYDGTKNSDHIITSEDYYFSPGVLEGDVVGVKAGYTVEYANKDQNVDPDPFRAYARAYNVESNNSNYVFINDEFYLNGYITKKDITVVGIGYLTKVFDGTTTAMLSSGNYVFNGVINGDSVALTGYEANFDNENVGSNKLITVTALVINNSNYNLTATSFTLTGEITVLTITVVGVGRVEKPYDGTNAAEITESNYEFIGLPEGQTLLITGYEATFNGIEAGSATLVTVIVLELSNNNFVLSNVNNTFTIEGLIYAKSLPIIWSETTFTYDKTSKVPSAHVYDIYGQLIPLIVTGAQVDAGTYTATAILENEDDNYVLNNFEIEFTINPRDLSVAGATGVTKVYDATVNATLIAQNYSFTGLIEGDIVNLNYSAEFNNRHVDFANVVNVTLSGIDNSNYNLITGIFVIINSSITPLNITVEAAQDGVVSKVYDATVNVNGLTKDIHYEFVGVYEIDLNSAELLFAEAYYDSANVGQRIVTVNELNINLSDYNLTTESLELSGLITAQQVTIVAKPSSVVIKAYDGNEEAAINSSHYEFVGLQGSDKLELNGYVAVYNSKNVIEAETVTVTDLSISSNNYTLVFIESLILDGVITPRTITVQGKVGAVVEKVFDGNNEATLNSNHYEFINLAENETLTLSNYMATYDSADIGTRQVTVTNLAISNSNYNLTTESLFLNGRITLRELEIVIINEAKVYKVYDGTDVAIIEKGVHYLVLNALPEDEEGIDLLSYTALFNSKNVSEAEQVSVTGLLLNNENYSLATISFKMAGEITPKNITLQVKDDAIISKTYDGTTEATSYVSKEHYEFVGVIPADYSETDITFNASYENKNVAYQNNYVTLSGIALNNDNYSLNQNSLVIDGEIIRRETSIIEIEFTGTTKIYDENNNVSDEFDIVSVTFSNVVNGDEINIFSYIAIYENSSAGNKQIIVSNIVIDNDNYILIEDEVVTEGQIKYSSLTVVWQGLTVVYNGEMQIPTAYVEVLDQRIYLTVLSGHVTAGEYGVLAKYEDLENEIIIDDITYELLNNTKTFTILAKEISISETGEIVSKIYDGNKTAYVNTSHYEITGVIASDELSLEFTAEYNSKDVLEANIVIISNITINNDNYIVNLDYVYLTGQIIAKEITVVWGNLDLTYNGEEQKPTALVETGVVGEELLLTVTANQTSVNAGNYTAMAEPQEPNGNYILLNSEIEFTIKKKQISVNAAGIVITKVYDGTVNAAVNNTHYEFNGVIADEVVNFVSFSAEYNSKNVIEANVVVVGNMILNSNNYQLENVDFEIEATITPKETSVIWENTQFIYNAQIQNPSASVNSGVAGDQIVLTILNGQVNAGTYVAVAEIDGSDFMKTNYELINNEISYTINRKAISVSGTGVVTKVYDGTTVFSGELIKGVQYEINGVIAGDEVALQYQNATFRSKNVTFANNKLIVLNLSVDNLNYDLITQVFEVNGIVEAKNIIVKIDKEVVKTYDKSEPKLEYTVEGLVLGETLQGTLQREAGEQPGRYKILPGTLTSQNNPNYIITYQLADFVIIQSQEWMLYILISVIVLFISAIIISQALVKSRRRKRNYNVNQ